MNQFIIIYYKHMVVVYVNLFYLRTKVYVMVLIFRLSV